MNTCDFGSSACATPGNSALHHTPSMTSLRVSSSELASSVYRTLPGAGPYARTLEHDLTCGLP